MQLLLEEEDTLTATCTGNDFAISGDARIFSGAQGIQGPFRSEPTASGTGWSVTVGGGNGGELSFIRSSSRMLC